MTPRRGPDREALFERATARQGVFTLEEARASGYSQPLVQYFVNVGRFQRIGSGVYRLAEYPHTQTSRLAELSAVLGADAILSHESALSLYPVSDVAPSRYHFSLPRSRRYARRPSDDVVLHTITDPIEARDIVQHHGFKATSLARSIVDSARAGTAPEQIRGAVETGLDRGLIRDADLSRLLAGQSARVRALVRGGP